MKYLILAIIVGALVLASVWLVKEGSRGGTVPQFGANLDVSTSSQITVGGDLATTIFSANSNCSTRLISVFTEDIWVSTDPDVTPGIGEGIPVTATSTMTFDNDSVTCDAWTAFSANGTSTIFVTEYEL